MPPFMRDLVSMLCAACGVVSLACAVDCYRKKDRDGVGIFVLMGFVLLVLTAFAWKVL